MAENNGLEQFREALDKVKETLRTAGLEVPTDEQIITGALKEYNYALKESPEVCLAMEDKNFDMT